MKIRVGCTQFGKYVHNAALAALSGVPPVIDRVIEATEESDVQ